MKSKNRSVNIRAWAIYMPTIGPEKKIVMFIVVPHWVLPTYTMIEV